MIVLNLNLLMFYILILPLVSHLLSNDLKPLCLCLHMFLKFILSHATHALTISLKDRLPIYLKLILPLVNHSISIDSKYHLPIWSDSCSLVSANRSISKNPQKQRKRRINSDCICKTHKNSKIIMLNDTYRNIRLTFRTTLLI